MDLERVNRLGQDYDIAVEGKAFLLRPDTPREGRPRTLCLSESPDELSEPLKPASASPLTRPAQRATHARMRRNGRNICLEVDFLTKVLLYDTMNTSYGYLHPAELCVITNVDERQHP